MIKNPKGTDFPQGREEGNNNNNNNNSTEIGKQVTSNNTKAASSSLTLNANSTPWLRLKDPRIVRVSRVFGGKDRHSKVCTIRGLRDRRVRLSVPTAIQLYDLQERLGLNQPSKVVDWLLNAAKSDIDELPPLPPMPLPGSFSLLAAAQPNGQDQRSLGERLGAVRSSSSSSNFWSPNNDDDHQPHHGLWRSHGNDEKENLRGTRDNVSEIESKEDITLLQRTTNHPYFPGINMVNNIANSTTIPSSTNTIAAATTVGYRNWTEPPPNYPLFSGGGDSNNNNNNNLNGLNVVSLHHQPSGLSLSTGTQLLFGHPSNGNTSATTSDSSSNSTRCSAQIYVPNISSGMEIIHDPRQAMSHFQMQSLFPNPIMRSLFHFGASNSTNDHVNGSPSHQGKEGE